jgi:hypothetical protein
MGLGHGIKEGLVIIVVEKCSLSGPTSVHHVVCGFWELDPQGS